MRIIFAGTPPFAAAHLQALVEQSQREGDLEIVAVYTQPDRRAGRGKKLQPSAVKLVAEKSGLPVEQPLSLKDSDAQQTLRDYNADVMVVAAYGLILPSAVLETPRFGCINVHASLLPRWRGAAPVERAIMESDKTTGITIMQMDEGLDTGTMLLKASCAISEDETGDSLREKLAELGPPLLTQALQQIETLVGEVQDDSESTYAAKVDKAEASIDWRQSADTIERKVRAFTSILGCYSYLDDQRIKITAVRAGPLKHDNDHAAGTIIDINKKSITVQCHQSVLEIFELQIPGAKNMSVSALLNGRPDFIKVGNKLSSPDTDS